MSIADETYVLLTTFRKSGEGVGTPVWIAPLADGSCGFGTDTDSGKAKRIRNNPSVTLQPCDMRGRVKEGSAVVRATAEVLEGDAAEPVHAAIRRKHPVLSRLIGIGEVWRKVRKQPSVAGAIRMMVEQ